MKLFICSICGNIAELVDEQGGTLVCCGDDMTELVPNSTDASAEKHLPVVSSYAGVLTVSVGKTAHPMEDAHHIMFVWLETDGGVYRKALSAGAAPSAAFAPAGEKPAAAYAYCNLHGLWKTDV